MSTTQKNSARTLSSLLAVRESFNKAQTNGKSVSLADLIVLGGCAAVEKAAETAGYSVNLLIYARPHGRL